MTTQIPIQPVIKFNTLQVLKINFSNKYCGSPIIPNDLNLNLAFTPSFLFDNKANKNLDTAFCINFKLDFTDKEDVFVLSVEATGIFESNSVIDETFINSDFAKVNAPAIAFPFLRSFISVLTLNAGYNPIILPSFNFTKVVETK